MFTTANKVELSSEVVEIMKKLHNLQPIAKFSYIIWLHSISLHPKALVLKMCIGWCLSWNCLEHFFEYLTIILKVLRAWSGVPDSYTKSERRWPVVNSFSKIALFDINSIIDEKVECQKIARKQFCKKVLGLKKWLKGCGPSY